MRIFNSIILLVGALYLGACTTTAPKEYTLFEKEQPHSILILPPLNESNEAQASYSYLSTVSKVIAERGYYVYPVAVIDQLLKRNGLPTPGEMHQASLKKLSSVIGPDAVLYITLKNYGTKFQLINSSTQVAAEAKLISAKTGDTLWSNTAAISHAALTEESNKGGFLGKIIEAAVAQAINSSQDQSRKVAVQVNQKLFAAEGQGLPKGKYALPKTQ